MQPIPDPAVVPSPDPFIAQLRKDPAPDRPMEADEPNAHVLAVTKAGRGWLACVGHDGGGSGAGGDGSARVGRGEAGMPRTGAPSGRPLLARCCGARTRSGPGCRGLAMENGRCRMHGGASTGPRTPEGLAKLVAARTKHGRHGAARRALRRHHRMFVERARLLAEAEALWPYLSPDLMARLDRGPAELGAPPVHPSRVPGAPVVGKVSGEAGLGVVVPVVGRDARGRFAAGPRVVVPGRVLRGRAAERVIAQAEAAALAPWKAGIAQALMARGMVLAGRRAVRIGEVRNDPIVGRAMGDGGAASGVGEQRPYTRSDDGDDDVAVRAARRVMRVVEVRNDPIGGRAVGGGGAASGAGEQRPYTRSNDGDDDVAVRAACRAARIAGTSNDPIDGGATGGGGAASGAGRQRLYRRSDGGDDDVAVRAARRAVPGVEMRNDPKGGRATGGGAAASGASEQRPFTRLKSIGGGAGGDAAVGAGDAAARVAKPRTHPLAGRTTDGEFAIGAAASRPHARANGAGAAVTGRTAGIGDARHDPIPGNATEDKFAIGAVASRPQARSDGAGDDVHEGAVAVVGWAKEDAALFHPPRLRAGWAGGRLRALIIQAERIMIWRNAVRSGAARAGSAWFWGLLLAVGLALGTASARAETLLRLSETATVMVHPDELDASLRAEALAADPADAQRRVNAAMAEALAAAKAVAGVTVSTGGYFVWRVGPTPQDRTERWQANQSIELTSHDGTALLKLVGALQQKGLAVGQLGWRLSDTATKAARAEATTKAITALRGRAEAAAGLLGLQFGSFKEVRLDSTRPQPGPRMMMMSAQAAPSQAAPPSAEAADVSIEATAEADVLLIAK